MTSEVFGGVNGGLHFALIDALYSHWHWKVNNRTSCNGSGWFCSRAVSCSGAGPHRAPFSSPADVNECEVGNGGCESQCCNTIGSFYCKCAAGLSLAQDGKACAGRDGLHGGSVSPKESPLGSPSPPSCPTCSAAFYPSKGLSCLGV